MMKPLPVLTFALALAMAAPLSAIAQDDDTFVRGVAAYEDGDYEAAAEFWTPLAEDGSPEAQRNLAQLYRLGLGVERDNVRAYELYTAAAEQNSVEAQVNAAFLLLTGEGVDKNPEQAALWFARAADQGDALAQFNLGLMYEKGVGVPQDRDIARELYQLSANQGQKRALARLDEIENDLPPDGGETARRERNEQRAENDARKADAERERKRQDEDVKRVTGRAQAERDTEEKERVERARAEARTGPILIIEKVEDDPETEEDIEKADAMVDAMAKEEAGGEDEKESMKASLAAASKAPEDTPAVRRKPDNRRATGVKGNNDSMAKAPKATPADRSRMVRIRQIKDAETAYKRGDFRTSMRLLIPLAQEGMPVAQFWLGRMFNRGEGVQLNRYEAYSLWRSAAASGSVQAATALANLSNRIGLEEMNRAESYYQSRLQRRN